MVSRIECTCGKVLKVPSKYAGRKLRCTGCQRTMRLGSPVEEAPPPDPSTIGCVGCGARLAASVRVCLCCGSDPVSGEPLYADAEAEQASSQELDWSSEDNFLARRGVLRQLFDRFLGS